MTLKSATPGVDADNDAPLTNFSDCHAGILGHLATFGELPALLEPVARAHRIADETLQFFQEVVFNHHVEEEKDLFPAVLASAAAGRERNEVQHLVDQLTAEHRSIEKAWANLQPSIARLAKGQATEVNATAIEELISRYTAHARFEEKEFLPRSEAILARNSADMAALGLSLHMRHVRQDLRRHGLRGS